MQTYLTMSQESTHRRVSIDLLYYFEHCLHCHYHRCWNTEVMLAIAPFAAGWVTHQEQHLVAAVPSPARVSYSSVALAFGTQ